MGEKIVKYDVVVVGGGISGITAAYHYQKQGLTVALIEASDKLGGVIKSESSEYGILESGANSLAMTDKFMNLIREVGLYSSLVKADDNAKKRYIYLNGSPQLVSPKTILFSSKILSWKSRRRLITERFRKSNIQKNETLASAITRRLGGEVLSKMINPVVSGIYAGDTSRMEYKSSLKKLYSYEKEYGSFTKGFLSTRKKGSKREVYSSINGLGGFTQGIGRELVNVFLREKVMNVSYCNTMHIVQTESHVFESSKLILATPAYVTANWMEDVDLSQKVKSIRYPTLHSFQFVFQKTDVSSPLHSFGILFPKEENKSCLGVINYSSIFPSNSNSEHLTFTIFSDKKNLTIENLRSKVLSELKELYQIIGDPILEKSKVWEKSIPQFEVGYADLMSELDRYCSKKSGLEIIGNWRTGVAIGDCVY